MKRIISLCCVALIFMVSLAVPARADETDETPYLQLLDYGYSKETGTNNRYFGGSDTITMTYFLPSAHTVQYIDVLFTWNTYLDITASWSVGSTSRGDLTVVKVAGNVYRAFGNAAGVYASGVTVTFKASSTNTYNLAIESLKVGRYSWAHEEIEAYCEISATDYSQTIHYVPTDVINHRSFTATDNYVDAGYNLYIHTDEWRRFDYIDFLLYSVVDSVSSITCTIGGESVPIEVSYIENDSMTVGTFTYNVRMDLTGVMRSVNDYPMIIVSGNLSCGNLNQIGVLGCVGSVYINSTDSDTFWYSKIVTAMNNVKAAISSGFADLSGWIQAQTDTIVDSMVEQMMHDELMYSNLNTWILNQTAAIQDQFTALGTAISGHFTNLDIWIKNQTVQLSLDIQNFASATASNLGSIAQGIKDQTAELKTALYQWINAQTDAIVAAIRGDTAPGDSFQDEMDEQRNDLDDAQDVMESVTKPAIDDLDVSLDGFVSPSTFNSLVTPMSVFLVSDPFDDIIMVALILSMVSYVLYGKR